MEEHLGERLSALVDGELGVAEHERALIHLAQCESCRFEADMTRRLKRRLTGLCEPEPDMEFMGRLSNLGHDSGRRQGDSGSHGHRFDPPPGGRGFGSRPPLGSSRPLGGYPGGGGPLAAEATEPTPGTSEPSDLGRDGHTTRRHDSGSRGRQVLSHLWPSFPGGRFAVAGFAVATSLLGTAFIAGGGGTEDAPVVEPRLSDYAVEHAVTSRQMPVVETQQVGVDYPAEAGTTQTTR